MRILCIDSGGGNALDFLMRCQKWGHQVRYYNKPLKGGVYHKVGDNIVPKIEDFDSLRAKWIDWADLIYLPDNAQYVDLVDPYRKLGYPVWGPSPEARDWELDRAKGQAVFKRAGIKTIPGREFRDYDSAIAYVKKEGKAFVSKPSGEADKALSYVSNSAADLVYMFERWKKNPKYVASAREHGFIIQEKKRGCEMGITGWFGPGGWAAYWEEDFEYKKLMAGDCGPNTGEMGTLTRFVKESKLADILLTPITKQLHEIGYVGSCNVNCMIDEEGTPWPFEFTMRDGWPAEHNEMALSVGDPAQWRVDLINGKDTREVTYNLCSISVVVAIPDFPYSHITNKETEGIPIYGCEDMEHVHLSEAMLGEAPIMIGDEVVNGPCFLTTGDYVLVVCGTGETITGARRSAYSALKKVNIPNSPLYRTDIGRGKLVEELPRIQKLGYAKGLSY